MPNFTTRSKRLEHLLVFLAQQISYIQNVVLIDVNRNAHNFILRPYGLYAARFSMNWDPSAKLSVWMYVTPFKFPVYGHCLPEIKFSEIRHYREVNNNPHALKKGAHETQPTLSPMQLIGLMAVLGFQREPMMEGWTTCGSVK